MNNLHYLLKEINLIRERYAALNEEKEHFNIFTTLRDQSEEVEEIYGFCKSYVIFFEYLLGYGSLMG